MSFTDRSQPHRVVILGGGFAGLYAAQTLGSANVQVTLVDKRNFHLFQPLLYQVATGGLSPGDIASPLRAVLKKHKNIRVLQGQAIDIDPERQHLILTDGEVPYDSLIVATGASHHYFGNNEWARQAPGLKTIEDALDMRRRIFESFEAAERESDEEAKRAWLNFVVVGGGPTGIELSGALAELAHRTLIEDFREIDPTEAKITLLEAGDRILQSYPAELSQKAQAKLESMGVDILTNTMLSEIDGERLQIKGSAGNTRWIQARTVLWAAGVKASFMGQVLAERFEAELDRTGRLIVEPDLSLLGHPNVFVVGDLANFSHQNGKPLPGVAPVAMQQGRYVATLIRKRVEGKKTDERFRYRDKGSLAVIGRNAAVADFGSLQLTGFPAWIVWILVHIRYLIEYDNKILVLIQWAWNYFSRKKGARLITGDDQSLSTGVSNAPLEKQRDEVAEVGN